MSRPVLVARDAHAEPVPVRGGAGPIVIAFGPAGSLDLDEASAVSLRDALDRALTLAAAQQQRPRLAVERARRAVERVQRPKQIPYSRGWER